MKRCCRVTRAAAAETALIAADIDGVLCWLFGRRIPIRAVDLRNAEFAYCADYRAMFCEHLRFKQARTRLIFADDFLHQPIRRNTAELQGFLARLPANIPVKYRAPDNLAQRIKADLPQRSPRQ